MKNLILISLLAFSLQANAAIKGAPFIPEVDLRFNALETGVAGQFNDGFKAGGIKAASLKDQAGNPDATGIYALKVAKSTFSMVGKVAGTYSLAPVLPAGAIIRQAWFEVAAQPAPSGTTIAFQCVSANDVFSAADETAASVGAIVAGVETGVASTMLYSSAGCTLKAVIAVHTATAGVLNLFVEYVVAN